MKGKQYLNAGDVVTFGHLGGHAVAPGQSAPKQPAEFQFVVCIVCVLHDASLFVASSMPNPVHKFINIFGTLGSMLLCITLLTGSPQNEIPVLATPTVVLPSCLRTRLHLLQRTVEVVSLLVDVHRHYSLQGLLADHGSSLAYAMVCVSTYVTLMCCG